MQLRLVNGSLSDFGVQAGKTESWPNQLDFVGFLVN